MAENYRSERMALTYSLSNREKRQMTSTLLADAEAVEEAKGTLDDRIVEYWSKGLSIANIMSATGVGHMTIKKLLHARGVVDPE